MSGAASLAVVHLLSDRGVPANEVVVTRAEQTDSGEMAHWAVTVLRGRERAVRDFPEELVNQVLKRGPCPEWYDEVGQLLQAVGVTFPEQT